MSIRSKTPTFDDSYCQICSSISSVSGHKRLSSFTCEHCRLSMCYECFEKHTKTLLDEYTQIQKQFLQLNHLFHNKKQLYTTFEEQCIRTIDSTFDEIIYDLENLRKESINYVKQQFYDTQVILSNMITELKPIMTKSQQNWSRDGITKDHLYEIDYQRKQINDIEKRLEIFSSPIMQLKMSTYPRNKLNLNCQLLSNIYQKTNQFSSIYPGKIITTQCTCGENFQYENDKIDVNTEIEELNQIIFSTKQTQTDPIFEPNYNTDDDQDEYFSLHDETSDISNRIATEYCLSTNYISQGTILTQNEVDRIASDGEHILYFSDTSKSLCYVTNISSDRKTIGISTTKEITCRWPYHPILDLVYSSFSSQFICATKTGIYTCKINSDNDEPTIDTQIQLTQHWSYVRLSTDKDFLWIWTDTPRMSQLHIYSPITFDCIKTFNLKDYPRFSDNSTSFCIHSNLIATVFQYKQTVNSMTYKKNFHVTLCDNTTLHEICTIRLGECDIDHEIRSNNYGKFFITNGRRKLWIIDQYGKKEYVKLHRTGRALTIHQTNQILIANGTQQLQCIELLQST